MCKEIDEQYDKEDNGSRPIPRDLPDSTTRHPIPQDVLKPPVHHTNLTVQSIPDPTKPESIGGHELCDKILSDLSSSEETNPDI